MATTKVITLNVGGQVFKTTLATLQTLPHTLLAELTNPALPLDQAVCDCEYQWLPLYYDRTESEGTCGSADSNERLGDNNVPLCRQNNTNEGVFTVERNGRTTNGNNTEYSENCNMSSTNEGKRARSSFIHIVNSTTNSATPLANGYGNQKYQLTNHMNQSNTQNYGPITPAQPRPVVAKSNPLLEASQSQELFFDRNALLIPYLLDAYRLGQLHLPTNICSTVIREELKFWKIPEDMISECCWHTFHDGLDSLDVVDKINVYLDDPYEDPAKRDKLNTLGKIWLTMDRPSYSIIAKIWCVVYYIMLIVSLLVVALATVNHMIELKPEFEQQLFEIISTNGTIHTAHAVTFFKSVKGLEITEYFVRIFFTLELVVRGVCCPEKLIFFRNVHNIVDIVIVFLHWTVFFIDMYIERNVHHFSMGFGYFMVLLNCSLALSALRVIHLGKHLREIKVMYLSAAASLRELLLLAIIVVSAALVFGTLVFLAEALEEDDSNDLVFDNIPTAVWWAIITMTTVGYGDYSPVTTSGRVVAVTCAITGILVVALPIAIIAGNFSTFYINITARDQRLRRENIQEQFKHHCFNGNSENMDPTSGEKSKKLGLDSSRDVPVDGSKTGLQRTQSKTVTVLDRKNAVLKNGAGESNNTTSGNSLDESSNVVDGFESVMFKNAVNNEPRNANSRPVSAWDGTSAEKLEKSEADNPNYTKTFQIGGKSQSKNKVTPR